MRPPAWAGSAGRAGAPRTGRPSRRKRRWTRSGPTPAALWAKDLHSLWLNSAALALAQGDLDVEGGVVERDESGEPTGVLREEAAWRFRELFLSVSEEEWVEVTRTGVKLAHSRGVTAIHDKDGWVGAPRIFQRLRDREGLTLRVGSSVPWKMLREPGRSVSAPDSATASCGSAT